MMLVVYFVTMVKEVNLMSQFIALGIWASAFIATYHLYTIVYNSYQRKMIRFLEAKMKQQKEDYEKLLADYNRLRDIKHDLYNYVNTTTEVKTLSDVCVTSSSAVKIVKNMPEKDILFIPDCNLGSWVKKQVPEKNIKLVSGGCPTHVRVTVKDVEKAKAAHPNALLLVHPECLKEVTELADYAGSTTGIMDYAAKSDAKEFIIGTENSIVSHLQLAHPEKRFYALSKDCVCHNMKMTTLGDVYNCVVNGEGESITLTEETMQKARKSIDAMLRLG